MNPAIASTEHDDHAQGPRHEIKLLSVDADYTLNILKRLLQIPSPTGYTDTIVHFVGDELVRLGLSVKLTRRGAIHAELKGERYSPDRAIVSHVDTLGAMVKNYKPNGRLQIAPIGTWSSRFAEGARVTLLTDDRSFRGTILPLLASGHTFGDLVDTQMTGWDHVELRIDANVKSEQDLRDLGINIGDFIAIDTGVEITETGYINARHLDNKAGVAAMLTAAKAITEADVHIPVDCHLVFTISEEVGSGASSAMQADMAEMVAVDNATPAPGQNSIENGVTVAMMDSSGPFDYHLTHKLLDLCRRHDIRHARDVFRHYRCDAASAILSGNDLRTALVCFGVDASHGYERTHVDSLAAVARLLCLYVQSQPTFQRDRRVEGPLKGFPRQHIT